MLKYLQVKKEQAGFQVLHLIAKQASVYISRHSGIRIKIIIIIRRKTIAKPALN